MSRYLSIPMIILIMAGLGACKKYPEGPSFSLKSKKARVANTWKIDYYAESGVDLSNTRSTERYTFEKDGDATIAIAVGSISISTDGDWHFANDEEHFVLTINYTSGNTTTSDTEEYVILRLASDEFWIETLDGVAEYKMVPA